MAEKQTDQTPDLESMRIEAALQGVPPSVTAIAEDLAGGDSMQAADNLDVVVGIFGSPGRGVLVDFINDDLKKRQDGMSKEELENHVNPEELNGPIATQNPDWYVLHRDEMGLTKEETNRLHIQAILSGKDVEDFFRDDMLERKARGALEADESSFEERKFALEALVRLSEKQKTD